MRDPLGRRLPDDPAAAEAQRREADAIAGLLASSMPAPAARAIAGSGGQPAQPRPSLFGISAQAILALARRSAAAERRAESLEQQVELLRQRIAALEAERAAGAQRLILP